MPSWLMGGGPGEMQGLLLESADLRTFLGRLTEAAASEMSRQGKASCSVTLVRERRAATVAFSDDRVAALDELQYRGGGGPCMTALLLGRAVQAQDLVHEGRWPGYRRAAVEAGVRSVLAVPIALEPGARAALNCYSDTVAAFDEEVRASAAAFAELASSSVRLAVRMESDRDRIADLEAALESRTAINLAVGVIMAQSGCGQEQAVDILRRASISRSTKLRDVASQILARFGEADPMTHFD